MVAVERDIEAKVEDAVVCREVVGPEERLLTKLDTRREESEHGPQDR